MQISNIKNQNVIQKSKSIKNFAFCFVILIFAFCILNLNVYAYDLTVELPGYTEDPKNPLGGYLEWMFVFIVATAGILALLMIMIGGFQYITAGGNESRAGQGRNRIQNAIIGLILALCSYVILNTINPDLVHPSLPGLWTINPSDFKWKDLGIGGDIGDKSHSQLENQLCAYEEDCQYDLKCDLSQDGYLCPEDSKIYYKTKNEKGEEVSEEANCQLNCKSSCQNIGKCMKQIIPAGKVAFMGECSSSDQCFSANQGLVCHPAIPKCLDDRKPLCCGPLSTKKTGYCLGNGSGVNVGCEGNLVCDTNERPGLTIPKGLGICVDTIGQDVDRSERPAEEGKIVVKDGTKYLYMRIPKSEYEWGSTEGEYNANLDSMCQKIGKEWKQDRGAFAGFTGNPTFKACVDYLSPPTLEPGQIEKIFKMGSGEEYQKFRWPKLITSIITGGQKQQEYINCVQSFSGIWTQIDDANYCKNTVELPLPQPTEHDKYCCFAQIPCCKKDFDCKAYFTKGTWEEVKDCPGKDATGEDGNPITDIPFAGKEESVCCRAPLEITK